MSYILDALKRADAERSHAAGGATLSSQPALASSTAARGRGLAKGLLVGALSLLVLAALATWWWRTHRAPARADLPAADTVAAAPATPPAALPTPAGGTDTANPPPQGTPERPVTKPFVGPKQTTATVLTPPPMPANGPDRAADPAQTAARGAAQLPIQGRPLPPRDVSGATPSPTDVTNDAIGTMAPGAPAVPGAGVPAALPAMSVASPEPTPAITAPLPLPSRTTTTTTATPGGPTGALAADAGLKVTGATYSENPTYRLLIVNGKVVKEGQEVEPGVVLEVISPRSAVFRRQGTRFNVNY